MRAGLMEDAVQDGGGDDTVAEDLPSAAEALVARDHGPTFVASADELKNRLAPARSIGR
jgi:hypothetical protein